MSSNDDRRNSNTRHQAGMTIAVVTLGVAILAFLVLIDNQRWFALRPATGTAAAMYHAADRSTVEPAATAR